MSSSASKSSSGVTVLITGGNYGLAFTVFAVIAALALAVTVALPRPAPILPVV